jgi:hypothetical protein
MRTKFLGITTRSKFFFAVWAVFIFHAINHSNRF